MDKLPVIFKMEGADVVACFPTLPGTYDPATCTVYRHVGQHGSADTSYCASLPRAMPEAFQDLRGELSQIYSDSKLRIVRKFMRSHYKARQC